MRELPKKELVSFLNQFAIEMREFYSEPNTTYENALKQAARFIEKYMGDEE